MPGKLKGRYTVNATKCNNVPIELGDFEIDESMTVKLPASAIDFDAELNVLEVDTTSGPLRFELCVKHVAPALRKWVSIVNAKVVRTDAMCPAMFRSTGNANNPRS